MLLALEYLLAALMLLRRASVCSSRKGQGQMEYLLILMLIVLAGLIGLSILGLGVGGLWGNLGSGVEAAGTGS